MKTLTLSNTIFLQTALDPAGPCFTNPCKVDNDSRVSEDDADYVQIIHTHALVLGSVDPDGSQDFYLNLAGILTLPNDPILGSHVFALWMFIWTCDPDNWCVTAGNAPQRVGIHFYSNKTNGEYHINSYGADCPFPFADYPTL